MKIVLEVIHRDGKRILVIPDELNIHSIVDEIKIEPKKDPYLQPGWPCEVWDDGIYTKHLRYFVRPTDSGRWFAESVSGLTCMNSMEYDNYRPIGTEWDFAPDKADYIVIGQNGNAEFMSNGPYCCNSGLIKTVLPKEYYGQTMHRPEWAK